MQRDASTCSEREHSGRDLRVLYTLVHAGPGSNLCVYCAGDLKDNVFADLNFERGLLRVLGHVNLELTLPDHVEAS